MKTFSTENDTHLPLVMVESFEILSKWAARFIRYQAEKKGSSYDNPFVLGTATGSSPRALYQEMAMDQEFYRRLDMRFVQLDEYCGVSKEHPNSYWREIQSNVLARLGREEPWELLIPPSSSSVTDEELGKFDNNPLVHSLDVQILGLGADGHLAFIQPQQTEADQLDAFLNEGTRKVELQPQNRAANMRFFGDSLDAVPTHAVTRGPRSILSSTWNIVIVNNSQKAMAAYAGLSAPLCREVPATILQYHPRTVWLVVKEAAHILTDWGIQKSSLYYNPLCFGIMDPEVVNKLLPC